MVIVIQYNVDVYGCGLRDLVPLVGILSVFVIVRVYAGVIMGVGGGWYVCCCDLLGDSRMWIGYLQVPYSIIVDPVCLCDACCICERFGGSWISVRWLSTG